MGKKKIEIREAKIRDIPEIVNLLKRSLGESLLPKSEQVWKFKHFDNPFGESLVLIAVVEDKLVGVRALMRWKWFFNDEDFPAFRAVDTAVLPEYQGQGIFHNLNARVVDQAQSNGDAFIFNTPNSQSLPGNLKLGWNKINKIKIRLNPSFPHYFFLGRKSPTYTVKIAATTKELRELIKTYDQIQQKKSKLYTPKSLEYLKWRYEKNPLQEYEVIADKDFYLAAYVKNHKYFTELRLTEHIFKDQIGLKKIKRVIIELSKKFRSPVISYSPHLNLFPVFASGNFGPILTLRDLNLKPFLHDHFLRLNNWEYTLGDLELF